MVLMMAETNVDRTLTLFEENCRLDPSVGIWYKSCELMVNYKDVVTSRAASSRISSGADKYVK